MTKKRQVLLILLLILGVLWTVFIFSRSAKTVSESAKESGQVTSFLQMLLGGLPISEHLIRKLAHFAEYLILSLPLAGAALLLTRQWLLAASWGYTVAVAVCDEFIVQAISGRGSRISDVLIDSAGSLLGVLFMVAVVWFFRRMHKRRGENLLKK